MMGKCVCVYVRECVFLAGCTFKSQFMCEFSANVTRADALAHTGKQASKRDRMGFRGDFEGIVYRWHQRSVLGGH